MEARQLQLRAGRASRRGGNKPGPARDYSLKTAMTRNANGSGSPNLTTASSSLRGRKSHGRGAPQKGIALTGFSSFARENQPPRQNWGKFKAHKWGGFTGRLKHCESRPPNYASLRCRPGKGTDARP